jgi:hypothetical protein
MASAAALMARRLDWAQRMVREDDSSARGALERELFATVVESDEQVLSMFSEWNQRSIPPHPLAELESAIALRKARRSGEGVVVSALTRATAAATTVGVKSIEEQLMKTLDLIRCTSSSQSRSDEDDEGPRTYDGDTRTRESPAHNDANDEGRRVVHNVVGMRAPHQRGSRRPTGGLIAAKRVPSPDTTSTNWMTQTDTATFAAHRRLPPHGHGLLHPVDFGGVLEILQGEDQRANLKPAEVPPPHAVPEGEASPRPRRMSPSRQPAAEIFPSPHLLILSPSDIRHYPLASDYSMERVDFFTTASSPALISEAGGTPKAQQTALGSQRFGSSAHDQHRPPQASSTRKTTHSSPSPQQHQRHETYSTNQPLSRDDHGSMSPPGWLATVPLSAPANPAASIETHIAGIEAPGAIQYLNPTMDVSVAGLQNIVARVSNQLRQRDLHHQRSLSRGSTSSPRRTR